MKFVLKKHHRLAIAHLMDNDSAALFAGLGLGKTLCTLLAFRRLQLLGLARSALIVAPLRVACLTWPNEIEKWAVTWGMKFADLRTAEGMAELRSGTCDIYLINYDMLTRFAKQYLRKMKSYAFDTVIYDELTCAKSAGSKRINRIRKQLTPRWGVKRRWGLTGTPTPNDVSELFAQIRLLDDGERLGTSKELFMDTHFRPKGYMGYKWEILEGHREKIYDLIQDITLSLPSEVYTDIPQPVIEDVEIALPKEAHAVYKELSKKLVTMIEGKKQLVALSAAVLVNKLLQITGGTVYHEDRSVSKLHSAKLDALRTIVTKHRKKNESVIIACNYIHEKKRILHAIPGACEFVNDKRFLADWNRGDIPVIVTHPKSLGHGLNMQAGGHIVVWFSLPWSRELYDQLNGRVARTGQDHICRIYRILCSGTIDDAVAETLRDRGTEQAALMSVLHNYKRLIR